MLTAVSVENRIDRDEHGYWLLLTRSDLVTAAERELNAYVLENRPIPKQVMRTIATGWHGVVGYLIAIWAVPTFEGYQVFDVAWRFAGRMDAGLVGEGEWWRLVTALTLHADTGHLVANSLFGMVFGLAVGRYLGAGYAWLLILVGGATGNALNAWMRPDEFMSLGASTATFAALGILAAYVWRSGYYRSGGWRRGLTPIFGAIALFAFTGVGGERTDVFAHIAGLVSGLGLGLLAASFDPRRWGKSGQVICGAVAYGVLIGSWMLAA